MEQLVNFIIRPPRAEYSPKNDLLDEKFMLKGKWFERKDIEVKNERGLALQCSHYVPLHSPDAVPLPCVIYCHGNSGCRADASEAAIILLPSNITVFTLDFSGSGLSEGEHVTLGWNEKEDLKAVVKYLRTDGNVSCIGLWGRSMGAVTSLMYGVEDPSIAGMVLDSPFSNLVDLMMELVDTYKYPLPKFTVKLAIQHMRRIIKKKANFDIMDLDTVQVAKCSFVPALFGHATDDDFINPHHSDRIYDSYTGDKNIIKFDGDHNSPRPQFYFDSITIFFHNVLNPPKGAFDEQFYQPTHDYFDEDNWESINDLEYEYNKFLLPSSESKTSSTEDAINQVRQRRPMSRTDVPSDVHGDLPVIKEGESTSGRDFSSHDTSDLLISTASKDEYMHFTNNGFSEMPSTIEDEERMLMEALLMSLKDAVVTETEKVDQTSDSGDTKASTSQATQTSPSSTASELSMALPSNTPVSLPKVEKGKENIQNEKSSNGVIERSTDGGSSSEGTGTSTSAKLVVQKNSSSNLLDGLAHKWGNLFKHNG